MSQCMEFSLKCSSVSEGVREAFCSFIRLSRETGAKYPTVLWKWFDNFFKKMWLSCQHARCILKPLVWEDIFLCSYLNLSWLLILLSHTPLILSNYFVGHLKLCPDDTTARCELELPRKWVCTGEMVGERRIGEDLHLKAATILGERVEKAITLFPGLVFPQRPIVPCINLRHLIPTRSSPYTKGKKHIMLHADQIF